MKQTRQEKKYFNLRRAVSLNRMTEGMFGHKFNEDLYRRIRKLEAKSPELREAYNLS